jgi:hypothetical protein
VPTTLQQGELAVNITDKKMWVGNAATTPVQILGAGATNRAGGSKTQVQYNSSGDLAGSANLIWDNANSRLGVGTGSPSGKLHVSGGSNPQIVFDDAISRTYGIGVTSSAMSFYDVTASAERMRIDSGGYVGIANTAPPVLGYEKFGVTGSGAFSTTSGTALGLWNTANTGLISFFTTGSGTNAGSIQATGAALSVIGGSSLNLTASGANSVVLNTNSAPRLSMDSVGNVRVYSSGTTSPTYDFSTLGEGLFFRYWDASPVRTADLIAIGNTPAGADTVMRFFTNQGGGAGTATEKMRIDTNGNLLVATTSGDVADANGTGASFSAAGNAQFSRASGGVMNVNRKTDDGVLVYFQQDASSEGTISVSGTTVSYNGGHLSRWSQLFNNSKDDTILKGTVLSNLDEMNTYVDAEENVAENEQLNKVKVSNVEGDVNVAGVFVNWSFDEQHNVDEINMAMTGDMIIRIAQGVTVQRGDLLMSAGDGTAKPQDDDIVRAKTIAKVTSTHVTSTYADGSYCVPCVLMAC